MNLLCWLLGHQWGRRWWVKEQDGRKLVVVYCLRCGAVDRLR